MNEQNVKISDKKTIGVIGAGAWGTALAIAAARAGHSVTLWMRDEAVAAEIQSSRINQSYLPDHTLPLTITATADPHRLTSCDALLLCAPAQHLDHMLGVLKGAFAPNVPLLICAKGIVIKTGHLLSQIVQMQCPHHPVGVLTGPSFAHEVAQNLPTALTLAMDEPHAALAYDLCGLLSTTHLRVYVTHDVVGAQIGGALKNVIAIACGIAAGKKLGDNARAALITRGLAEIVRFGRALGADSETFLGLSGLGDLTLTCNAMQSRNFSLGVLVGRGEDPQKILSDRHSVSEGVYTAEAVVNLAQRLGVEMPICEAVYETLSGAKSIDYVIKGLLERPAKTEAA
ncbi:MAG TPA: NAD(P)H-dependent glycerol-3-phosphate dehydrogenase [Alphaproteobacteria bacterium]